MGITAAKLLGHPGLAGAVRRQCGLLLSSYNDNPRLGAVFATQQRWLLAHAGLAVYFESLLAQDAGGIRMARFLDLVREHAISSRNTADAFMKEMQHYGAVLQGDPLGDRRARPLTPSPETLGAITGWTLAHLITLDALDEGSRVAAFHADPQAIARMQPAIAAGLFTSAAIRKESPTFSLFSLLNNGGVIMDWMIVGMGEPDPVTGRIATPVVDVADMARWMNLSRTHLQRKLREAEALDSLGWEGARGRSAMWVSRGFLDEILAAQANKLAVVDAACADAGFR